MLLITGFKPMGSWKRNASELLAEWPAAASLPLEMQREAVGVVAQSVLSPGD